MPLASPTDEPRPSRADRRVFMGKGLAREFNAVLLYCYGNVDNSLRVVFTKKLLGEISLNISIFIVSWF